MCRSSLGRRGAFFPFRGNFGSHNLFIGFALYARCVPTVSLKEYRGCSRCVGGSCGRRRLLSMGTPQNIFLDSLFFYFLLFASGCRQRPADSLSRAESHSDFHYSLSSYVKRRKKALQRHMLTKKSRNKHTTPESTCLQLTKQKKEGKLFTSTVRKCPVLNEPIQKMACHCGVSILFCLLFFFAFATNGRRIADFYQISSDPHLISRCFPDSWWSGARPRRFSQPPQ